jgi:hypothetical protein
LASLEKTIVSGLGFLRQNLIVLDLFLGNEVMERELWNSDVKNYRSFIKSIFDNPRFKKKEA